MMRHAKAVFRVPLVAVYMPSLADKDTQLTLRADGTVQTTRLSRRSCKCMHDASKLDVVVVQDADSLEDSSKLHKCVPVKLNDHVRFFAMAPIFLSTPSVDVGAVEERIPVGRLCILDDAPREFGSSDQHLLWEVAVLMSEMLEREYRTVQWARAERIQLTISFLSASVDHPQNLASSSSFDDTVQQPNLPPIAPAVAYGFQYPSAADTKRIESAAFNARAAIMCQSVRSTMQATAAFVVDVSQLCAVQALQSFIYHPAQSQRYSSHRSDTLSSATTTPVNDFAPSLSVSDTELLGALPSLLAYDGPNGGQPKVDTVEAARELGELLPYMLSDATVRFFDTRKSTGSTETPTHESANSLPFSPHRLDDRTPSSPGSPISARTSLGGRIRDADPIPYILSSSPTLKLGSMMAALPVASTDRTSVHLFFLTFQDLVAFDDMDMQLFQGTSDIYQASLVRQQAQSASDAQLQFIQSVQHELRTPLHGVLGTAEFLKVLVASKTLPAEAERAGMTPDELTLRLINTLTLSATSLSGLLEDVLDFGKVTGIGGDGRKHSPEATQPMDIVSLVEECARDEFEKVQHERRAKAVTDKDLLCPQLIMTASESVRRSSWECAGITLRKVIQKILNNSLRFTCEGTVEVHLATTLAEDQPDTLVTGSNPTDRFGPSQLAPSVVPINGTSNDKASIQLTVIDSGLGMSPDFLRDGLLKPFVKHNTFKTGVGLGIPLAVGLIEQMQGQVSVQSELARGTKITIRLPLKRGQDLDLPDLWAQRSTSGGVVRSEISKPLRFALAPSKLDRTGSAIRQFLLTGPCAESLLPAADVVIVSADDPKVASEVAGQLKESARVAVVCRETDRSADASAFVGHALHRIRPPWSVQSRAALRDFMLDPKPFALQPPPLSRRQSPAPADSLFQSKVTRNILRSPVLLSTFQELRFPSSPPLATPPTVASLTPNESAAPLGDATSEAMSSNSSSTQRSPPAAPKQYTCTGFPWSYKSASSAPSSTKLLQPPLQSRKLTAPPVLDEPPDQSCDTVVDNPGESSTLCSRAASTGWLEAMGDTVRGQNSSGSNPSEFPDTFRVLIVEDNVLNSRILALCVKRLGLPYDEARDGVEAVAKFQLFKPQVVLLDMSMPLKDGFQAATEMRCVSHPIGTQAKIIAITALSDSRDRERGLHECGINEWRTKPVSVRMLRQDLIDWHTAWKREHESSRLLRS